MTTKRFAIIGVAGYIAPRHLDAIRDVGGTVVAAYDTSDSVGRLDASFPKARFFTEFELFASYVEALALRGQKVDYVSVCSPNYLHRAHIEFALRAGADVICEKPLVLSTADVDALAALEKQTGRSVSTILQLRLNPANIALRAELQSLAKPKVKPVCDLTYITARGHWYHASWKADDRRSGGISMNIGVHLFDLLSFLFGSPVRSDVHHRAMDCSAGLLEFETAKVRWFLSINGRDLPENSEDRVACRRIIIGDRICNLSGDFRELHTKSYQEVLAGRGFPLSVARSAVEVVGAIRQAELAPPSSETHPALANVLADKGRYVDGYPA